MLAIPLSDAVRDSADLSVESSAGAAGEPAKEPAPENNGRGAVDAPIVALAAGAPSTATSRARN